MIKVKTELRTWLVDYIVETIHSLHAANSEGFDYWAKHFKKEEAKAVVDMEYIVECSDIEDEEISCDDAKRYAEPFLKRILDNWYLSLQLMLENK